VKWTWARGTAVKTFTIWSTNNIAMWQENNFPLWPWTIDTWEFILHQTLLAQIGGLKENDSCVRKAYTLRPRSMSAKGNGYHAMVWYTSGDRQSLRPLCTPHISISIIYRKSFVVLTSIKEHLSQFVAFPTQVWNLFNSTSNTEWIIYTINSEFSVYSKYTCCCSVTGDRNYSILTIFPSVSLNLFH